jgi:hypothetical protein
MPLPDSPLFLAKYANRKKLKNFKLMIAALAFSLLFFGFYTQLTDLPTLRFLFTVLRPLWVRILARKPLFRSFFILLLRWFSKLFLLTQN